MNPSLSTVINTSHEELNERLDLAATAMAEHAGTREIIQKTDAFLVNACRHVSAVCDVILPVAKVELPDGQQRQRDYVEQCRRLERAVGQAKRRLYGESHAVGVPWAQVWASVGEEFQALTLIEHDLVADLEAAPGVDVDDLAASIHDVEATSPTRPHPGFPHTGRLAHLSRQLWARADRFWDAAEGRIVSDPPIVPDKLAS